MTHTTTANLHAWAETFPWDCLVRATSCVSDTHDHTPMVGDPCNLPSCDNKFMIDERVFATIEVTQRKDGRDRPAWVCEAHVVQGDDG